LSTENGLADFTQDTCRAALALQVRPEPFGIIVVYCRRYHLIGRHRVQVLASPSYASWSASSRDSAEPPARARRARPRAGRRGLIGRPVGGKVSSSISSSSSGSSDGRSEPLRR